MDSPERIVRIYITASGRSPFQQWFTDLDDDRAQDRILARIARVRLGNEGDWKPVGGGVFELRVDYGPGYRLYFGREGNRLIILLAGGDKRTQVKDIKRAKVFWHDYKQSKAAKEF